MKKTYQKPTTEAFILSTNACILAGSPQWDDTSDTGTDEVHNTDAQGAALVRHVSVWDDED